MSFEEDISIFDKIENPIDNNYIEKSYSFEEEENDDTSNDIVDINAQPAYYDSLGRKIDLTRYGNVVVWGGQVESDDDTEKEQFILELISKSGRELDKQLIRLSQSKKNKHEENKPKPTMIKKEEYYYSSLKSYILIDIFL